MDRTHTNEAFKALTKVSQSEREQYKELVQKAVEEMTYGYNVKRQNKRVITVGNTKFTVTKSNDKIIVDLKRG